MIVATHARSGATKFCLDLAKKEKREFIGEYTPSHLNPLYESPLSSSSKSLVHETLFQPAISEKDFNSLETSDNIYMINKSAYLIVKNASFIIIRKDIIQSIYSFIDLLLRPENNTKLSIDAIVLYARLVFDDTLGLITRCKDMNNILWFEDLYPNHTQNLTYLNKINNKGIQEYFNALYSNCDLSIKIDNLSKNSS